MALHSIRGQQSLSAYAQYQIWQRLAAALLLVSLLASGWIGFHSLRDSLLRDQEALQTPDYAQVAIIHSSLKNRIVEVLTQAGVTDVRLEGILPTERLVRVRVHRADAEIAHEALARTALISRVTAR